jgi:hypothetical protein
VISGLQLTVLYLAPLLALAVLLICGRYPGERLLERLRRARRRTPLRGARVIAPRRRPPVRARSLLLCAALSGRGPPVVA